MSNTKQLIELLSDNEKKQFLNYLKSRNKRKDSRNITLFKYLANSPDNNRIKNEIGTNAFHVLNKRLGDNLIDFITQIMFVKDVGTEINILKQILISRKLLVYKKHKLAFKILHQVEQKAIEISDYTLLNEIYHTLIQYSYLAYSKPQSEIFLKFENNQKLFLAQERINMAYAVIKKSFHENEFHSNTMDIKELIENSFKKFGIEMESIQNYKTLFQLAEIADIAGAQKKDYHNVNLFFVEQMESIETKNDSKHLSYHIELLYIIANIYFRKKEFNKSLHYLSKMKEQMLKSDKKYYLHYSIKYATLLALAENYTGNWKKALEITEKTMENNKQFPNELSSILLIKVMLHFQQNDFEKAKKTLNLLHKSDKWYEKHIGLELALNKRYMEILLHIELGNNDYVDSKISSLVRTYRAYFKENNNFQIIPFLKLIKTYYNDPMVVKTEKFKSKIEKTIQWKDSKEEDVFSMSFYAWLKSKVDDKPLYEVTLDLVKGK